MSKIKEIIKEFFEDFNTAIEEMVVEFFISEEKK